MASPSERRRTLVAAVAAADVSLADLAACGHRIDASSLPMARAFLRLGQQLFLQLLELELQHSHPVFLLLHLSLLLRTPLFERSDPDGQRGHPFCLLQLGMVSQISGVGTMLALLVALGRPSSILE
ncbi:hypothetical protein PG994_012739 [Apiospora phragmitis]|uniref:Uncharacterized protein n=1 Tax=Apiospora phragmitis TaxID=2905665 RepID=A0ABR1TBD8_9PEZI